MTDHEFEFQLHTILPLLNRLASRRLFCPFDINDAVQECCLKAWRYRDCLWDDEKFPAWISQILINECRTIIRTKVRSKYDLLGDEALNRIEAYHEEDEFNDLRIAVGSLPETMKSAVALSLQGYRIYEVAELLRISQAAVKSRLHRAKRALKTILVG